MIIKRRSPFAELKRYIVVASVVILWFNLMFQTFYVLPYNIYVHCQFCLTSHFVSKHFLKSHFFSLITKPPQQRNEWCCLLSQRRTSMRKNNHKSTSCLVIQIPHKPICFFWWMGGDWNWTAFQNGLNCCPEASRSLPHLEKSSENSWVGHC